jgi:hypothetical protein
MNQKLNKRLHALLKQQGIKAEQKAEMVYHATNGRVTSSKDLTDDEALELIKALPPSVKTPKTSLVEQIKDAKTTNMLLKCFALFRQMGYTLFDKPDYTRINNFCIARSQAKKKLTDMTQKELSNLIYQLEKIVSKQ